MWKDTLSNPQSEIMRLMRFQNMFIVNERQMKTHLKKQYRIKVKDGDRKSPSDQYLDIFKFKIYCLLICRGELRDKTELLFDLVVAHSKNQ